MNSDSSTVQQKRPADREARKRASGAGYLATCLWTAFFCCAIAAIGFLFIPVFVIRPFRYQEPHALLLAMAVRQRAPLGSLIAAVACFSIAIALWSSARRLLKGLLAATLLLASFSAVMSRLNHFEWMFHPIDSAQFLAQSESKLDPKEMVMAVRIDGDARAYPISQMAYHHVLNDTVEGVPIAVTY
jgi:hypothetical protein